MDGGVWFSGLYDTHGEAERQSVYWIPTHVLFNARISSMQTMQTTNAKVKQTSRSRCRGLVHEMRIDTPALGETNQPGHATATASVAQIYPSRFVH